MEELSYLYYVVLVASCLVMVVAGLYLLGNFNTLFRRSIRNEWVRQNVVAWLVVFCFITATIPLNGELFYMLRKHGILHVTMAVAVVATVNVLFVYNLVRLISRSNALKKLSFIKQRVVIFLTIVISCVLCNIPINYFSNDYSTKNLKFSVIVSIYMAGITGLVYVLMTYLDAERNRKLQEKELELSKLNELKTKAELDALHSKVNPHFLYNALNSIADLAITDGRKARRMTIALADLFRYSINYSHNNYSTVKDELAMTEVYLQIEKIRFEDQLNYRVRVEEATNSFLIPRFILQPLVENAVKHGLKATGQMTEIDLEIKQEDGCLLLEVSDNGPSFPAELNVGYGVKSVYDKMDLLFPGQYEIYFSNSPHKKVSICIQKLIKNEPGV